MAIIGALRHNTHLTSVNLGSNEIASSGSWSWAASSPENPKSALPVAVTVPQPLDRRSHGMTASSRCWSYSCAAAAAA